MIVVMIAYLAKQIFLSFIVKSNQADTFVIKHVLFFHLQRCEWQHFMLGLLCFSVVMCTSKTTVSGVLDTIKKAPGGRLLAVILKLSLWTLHLMMIGGCSRPCSQCGLPLLLLLCYLRLRLILIFMYFNTTRATKELTWYCTFWSCVAVKPVVNGRRQSLSVFKKTKWAFDTPLSPK